LIVGRAVPLPTRDGVGASCVALPDGPWPTISAFLADRFPAIAPAVWAERMAAGDVLDEDGEPVTPTRVHQPRLRIYYYRSLPDEPRVPFDEAVLYQDEHIVVADKPHFLAVIPAGRHLQETLLVRLKRKLGIDMLAPVHRIDRETAGLVLFSVRPETRGAYQGVFAERRARKIYECVAPWRDELSLPLTHCSRLADDAHFMQMREVPGAPNSETRIELIERLGEAAHYRLAPLTGRRHQLRVHCAALGIPIANDLIYPVLRSEGSDDYSKPLQLLARSLAFTDPVTSEPREFESGFRLNLPAHQYPVRS
jgi:tRNA pseudouridine32 synthase/23S rRNA pseudouridine746 synthase